MLAFGVALVGVVALVLMRRALDRGSGERRWVKPLYADYFQGFADFETSGGRAHDLEWETGDWSGTLRGTAIRVWLGSFAATIVLTTIAWVIGIPWWIWIPLVAIYTIVAALGGELILHMTVASTTGERTRSAIVLLIVGSVCKALLHAGAAGLLWLGADLCGDGKWLLGALLGLVAVIVADNAHVPARVADMAGRMRQPIAFAGDSPNDTVLFLRSFDDDRKRIFSLLSPVGHAYRLIPGPTRMEEIIASLFAGESSNVACIGRPGERMPSLGAGRTYWTDETWQEAVQHTANRARAIVLMAGKTEGLAWEIGQLKTMGLLGKLIVLFPTDDVEGSRRRYRIVVQALDVPSEQVLDRPDEIYVVPAVCFSDGALVHLTAAGRNWMAYTVALVRFMAALNGSHPLDASGSFAAATDPVRLVQHCVRTEGVPTARAYLAAESDSARLVLARAWLDLKDGRDAAEVLTQLDIGIAQYPQDLALRHASAVLQTQGPSDDPDHILGDLRPKPAVPNPAKVTTARGTITLARRWIPAYAATEEALEAEDLDAAWASAEQAVEIARAQRVATAEAMSQIHRGKILLRRKDYAAVTALAERVYATPDLPRVRLAPTWWLEPWDVRDDALLLLADVADRTGSVDDQVAALHRLWAHRVESGQAELAAWIAKGLAEKLVDARRTEDAIRWATTAVEEYERIGRPAGRAAALLQLGRAHFAEQNWEPALAASIAASEAADPVEEVVTSYDARLLHGRILEKRAQMTNDPSAFAAAADVFEELRQWLRAHPEQTGPRMNVLAWLADAQNDAGRISEAIEAQQELVSLSDTVRGPADERSIRARKVLGHLLERASGRVTPNESDKKWEGEH